MSWRYPDRYEYMLQRCCARIKLYGGASKNQRQSYLEIPIGTPGIARQLITDGETGVQHFICAFQVGHQKLWTRCAPDAIELTAGAIDEENELS